MASRAEYLDRQDSTDEEYLTNDISHSHLLLIRFLIQQLACKGLLVRTVSRLHGYDGAIWARLPPHRLPFLPSLAVCGVRYLTRRLPNRGALAISLLLETVL